MKLTEYLAGLRAATTADELEAAIRGSLNHGFRGRSWSQICKVRVECGAAICAAHPHGHLVPRMTGRTLSVCGETYGVSRGGNSTGVRYVWHSAEQFAVATLKRHGLSQRAAHSIWGSWSDYPHRCLRTIEDALAGKIPDPKIDVLILSYADGRPLNYTVEQNSADELDRRATCTCPSCKGTLFDWGGGFSSGFTFVNWHCNGCSNVYTEYVSPDRFSQIRRPRPWQPPPAGSGKAEVLSVASGAGA